MFDNLNFPELLILLMFGALFFKDIASSFLRKKLGLGTDDVPDWADQLLQHFNHDMTDRHDGMKVQLDRMEGKMDTHNTMEKENNGKLIEILKYGVPIRKE